MKPHINIGMIGHTDHGKSEEDAGIKIPDVEHAERPARRSNVLGLLAMTAVLGAGYGMMPVLGGGRSSQAERNDPQWPKTDEDLKALDKAEWKRERKRRAKELAKRKKMKNLN